MFPTRREEYEHRRTAYRAVRRLCFDAADIAGRARSLRAKEPRRARQAAHASLALPALGSQLDATARPPRRRPLSRPQSRWRERGSDPRHHARQRLRLFVDHVSARARADRRAALPRACPRGLPRSHRRARGPVRAADPVAARRCAVVGAQREPAGESGRSAGRGGRSDRVDGGADARVGLSAVGHSRRERGSRLHVSRLGILVGPSRL